MDKNKRTIFILIAIVAIAGAMALFNTSKREPTRWLTQEELSGTTTQASMGGQTPPEPTNPVIAPQNPPIATPTVPPSNPPTTPPTTPPVTQPPATGSAQVITKVSTTKKVAVLTFDAGADRGFVAQILDTLKTEGIEASFGMTGKWAEQNPDIIRRISNEGHDFINHTYTHGSFTGFSTNSSPLTQAQRWQELDRTEAIIQELIGKSTKPYFRPPYGDYNASVNSDIFARGYRFNIMWTVDSLGWKGLSAEEIRQRVVSRTVPGAIHLFHVGEQSQDAAALPLIIDDLQAQGYSFARISDLVR
jgi:peptidoglycan-N-acetylglucosamine deacetylase